jgi:predicted dienelactone hydrolase
MQSTLRKWLRWTLRGVGAVIALVAIAISSLIAFLWIDHRRETVLPEPTGSFAVGRSIQAWADEATADQLAPKEGTRREVLVWIWYPAAAEKSAPKDDYTPDYMTAAWKRVRGPQNIVQKINYGWLTRDMSRVRAHSVRDPAVSRAQTSYPVVLLRGGASASASAYTTLAEDLASHGYVVVGIDAPYRTGSVAFPDGRVVNRIDANNPELLVGRDMVRMQKIFGAWISDMRFVVDRLERLNASDPTAKFTGRLDMRHLGAFGHSWGGSQAAQFCHDDPRCAAAIDIDGLPFGDVIQTGVPNPFMFLGSDLGEFSTDPEVRQIRADMKTLLDHSRADSRRSLAIKGAFHFTFSDDGALFKSGAIRVVLRVLGRLSIDSRRQLVITSFAVRNFFDAYLKNGGRTPQMSSPLYPELMPVSFD